MAERGCIKDGHFQNLEVEGLVSLAMRPMKTTIMFNNFTAAAGNTYLVQDTSGCTVVLPAPTTGDRIKIVFGGTDYLDLGNSGHKIHTDAPTTLFNGYALLDDILFPSSPLMLPKVFAPLATDHIFTLDGAGTGYSGVVELIGTDSNRWYMEAVIHSRGGVYTPFSST